MTAPGPGRFASVARIPRFRGNELAGFRFGSWAGVFAILAAGLSVLGACQGSDQTEDAGSAESLSVPIEMVF